MTQEKVSLIILAYDNYHYLRRAVISLIENTDYPDLEIIAVHNPCEDEEINKQIRSFLEETYQEHPDLFKYKLNEKNLLHARGIMEGFSLSNRDAKYIGILNDDIFIPAPEVNWLNEIIKFMEENPKAATVTPSLYHLNEKIYWCGRKKGEAHHMCLHYPKGDPRIPKEPLQTESNNMAVCLTRRSLLEEIPLGQNCPHYGSDSEYYNRIQEMYPDSEHWVLPQVKLYHDNIFNRRLNYGKDKEIEG